MTDKEFEKLVQERMEDSDSAYVSYDDEDIITRGQRSLKRFLSRNIGFIITILAIIMVFFVSSTEGFRPIKANNKTNALLMQTWREQTGAVAGEFPEERVDLIEYDKRTYYFVIGEVDEEGNVLDWYFAYDGGIEFVLMDKKTWVLTALVIVVSIIVSYNNYISTGRQEKSRKRVIKEQLKFELAKEKIQKYQQYIPYFVMDVNNQSLEMAKREVLERANLSYEKYINNEYDRRKLPEYQRNALREADRVKINPLLTAELLRGQEKGVRGVIHMLPQSEEEHRSKTMKRKLFTQIISAFLSSFVVGFGIILGNVLLGVSYAIAVLISAIGSILIAKDYFGYEYIERIKAKTGYLIQFDNEKEKYIKKVKEEQENKVKEELKQELADQKEKQAKEENKKSKEKSKKLIDSKLQ